MSTYPTLPAMRSLGQLADIHPTVVIDRREQAPLPVSRLPVTRSTLRTGDYSFVGGQELFSVERKSITDIVSCCMGQNRERFERELHRLRGLRFKRLLIVGTRSEIQNGQYRSQIKPSAVLHSLAAWEIRYDLPVVYCTTPIDAAQQVESWVFWFSRELVENANEMMRGHLSEIGVD